MSKRTGIVSGDAGRTYARSANAEPRESVSGSGDKGGRDCTNESKRKSTCNDQIRQEQKKEKQIQKLKQELKERDLEIARLKTTDFCDKPKCRAVCRELQQKNDEIALLKDGPCRKAGCVQLCSEHRELKREISHLRSEQCTNTKCREVVTQYGNLQIQYEGLLSDYEKTLLLENKNEKDTLLSEIEHTKKLLEESQKERDWLRSELQQTRENSNKLQTQISAVIGKGLQHMETGELITLSDAVLKLSIQSMQLIQQQAILQQQQKSSAACSDMEMKLREAHDEYQQLMKQKQDVIKSYEETIQDLKEQQYSGQCQRPECVKIRKEQRQKEVQQMGNPGKEVDKQCVVGHDALIHEFERLTSDLDGLLGLLEEILHEGGGDPNFEAKKLLCVLFQESYDNCKKVAIQYISTELESLFEVQLERTEEMDDASRGYGLLLHAFGLRTEEMRAQYSKDIKTKISCKICGDDTLQKVKEALDRGDEDYLGKVIELTWKFVTLPNPLIVCQPKKFDPQIHEQEFGHWDSKHKNDLELIYTRPVIYRNYEGALACKGWVANSDSNTGEGSKWSWTQFKQNCSPS